MAKKRGNGEGSISKRKDGRWVAAVTTGRDPNTGKIKRRFLYGKTREEVAKKLTRTLNNIHSGTYIDTNNTTVEEWCWATNSHRQKLQIKFS